MLLHYKESRGEKAACRVTILSHEKISANQLPIEIIAALVGKSDPTLELQTDNILNGNCGVKRNEISDYLE